MKKYVLVAKVIILGALAESLYNFRGDLIKSLVIAGHDVVAMAGYTDNVTHTRIEELGATFKPYPVDRNGLNPFNDFEMVLSLRSAFIEINPDVLLAYTIKPVIWGGLALRTMVGSAISFYALITGLGLAFQLGGMKQFLLAGLVTRLYRMALVRADRVIFQNSDNKQVFIDRRIVSMQLCEVVSGSGVNMSCFSACRLPESDFAFLTIARLLGDKGLREYAQAALIVKKKYPEVVFDLVGPIDPSPDGITLAEVDTWQISGSVNYLGSSSDVRPFIERCHVYVLPSYHEGMPRTVLEAMSMGRPILTTDVPGCRETVLQGENGYLVPARNVSALAERMLWFIENRKELARMGFNSRKIVEDRFDVKRVNADMLHIMRLQ